MITQEDLLDNLVYDADTGNFTWKKQNGPKIAGQPAGYPHGEGYVCVGFRGETHLAHRLAWLYMTGRWPANDVDHVNGDRSDNRWENLREATRSENLRNQKVRTNSKSGYKGITWDAERRKWLVQVDHKYVGRFACLEDAVEASKDYRRSYHGDFARH